MFIRPVDIVEKIKTRFQMLSFPSNLYARQPYKHTLVIPVAAAKFNVCSLFPLIEIFTSPVHRISPINIILFL